MIVVDTSVFLDELYEGNLNTLAAIPCFNEELPREDFVKRAGAAEERVKAGKSRSFKDGTELMAFLERFG